MNLKTLEFTNIVYVEEVRKIGDKILIVDDIFDILKNAYSGVTGGLHFKDKDDLLLSTDLWRIIYMDTEPIGVIIYKAKFGLKMVALGLSNKFRKEAKAILARVLRETLSRTWMEVSEGMEKFMLKLGCEKFFIPNIYAEKLTKKNIIKLCDDGYHYIREINGIPKRKVIVGFPKYW